MEESQAAKESLGRMQIKDNEARAHGPRFLPLVCLVLDDVSGTGVTLAGKR